MRATGRVPAGHVVRCRREGSRSSHVPMAAAQDQIIASGPGSGAHPSRRDRLGLGFADSERVAQTKVNLNQYRPGAVSP